MITEATRSTSTLALEDPITIFNVDVVFVPPTTPGGDDYAFKFFGLTLPNNAQVQTPQADFTLNLSTNGSGTVRFTSDPITWLPPGDQTAPIDRPQYITPPVAVGSRQVTFTDFNQADPTAMILVSFMVNVHYDWAEEDAASRDFSSAHRAFLADTFTSHDPTIINVDPTGSGNLTPPGA